MSYKTLSYKVTTYKLDLDMSILPSDWFKNSLLQYLFESDNNWIRVIKSR
jgi:hypothetical protein